VETAEELYELMCDDKDPDTFRERLNQHQIRLLQDYEIQIQYQKARDLQKDLEEKVEVGETQIFVCSMMHYKLETNCTGKERVPKRNVSTFVRLTICDYPPSAFFTEPKVTDLTIWNSEEVARNLEEGNRYRVRTHAFLLKY
jgi:hypothetical protein